MIKCKIDRQSTMKLSSIVNEVEELEIKEMIQGPIQEKGKNEIDRVKNKMKNNKASGVSQVCIKMFKELRELEVDLLWKA